MCIRAAEPSALRPAVAALARSRRALLAPPQRAPALVRAALQAGDHRRARLISDHEQAIAARTDGKLWRAAAQHTQGLIRRSPGLLREAVGCLRATTAKVELADALFDLGRTIRQPGGEAQDVLAECAALYARLGAVGDQAQVQTYHSHLNQRPVRRPHPPETGLAALTPRESTVAAALAHGATKQQAAGELRCSFHTIDAQVRSIYAKLGISKRVHLAHIWNARDEVA